MILVFKTRCKIKIIYIPNFDILVKNLKNKRIQFFKSNDFNFFLSVKWYFEITFKMKRVK